MRHRRTRPHALIGFLAVIGIVAMHGLTMNHDTAMPTMVAGHNTSVTVHASDSADHSVMAGVLTMRAAVADVPPVVPADGEASFVAQVLRAAAAPSPRMMATACLAFLAGLLLVGASRLLARLRRGTQASVSRDDVAWFATAIGRLRPDLAELSVLRT